MVSGFLSPTSFTEVEPHNSSFEFDSERGSGLVGYDLQYTKEGEPQRDPQRQLRSPQRQLGGFREVAGRFQKQLKRLQR